MSDFVFHELFPLGEDETPYRRLTADYVESVPFAGESMLKVALPALTLLAQQAMVDCQHLLRPGHLKQLRAILDDPEASANDRFVAFDLLKNANIAAGKVLPMCQDTGTAIVMGKKGQRVWTGGGDAAALAAGIRRTYLDTNLRYSQLAPLSMFKEVNTGDNLPAQIDLLADEGDGYHFLFIAKGGGSANKTFLFQATPAVLNEAALLKFLDERIRTLGTSACPPYHLSIVIGGTSAELNLKTVKLASCRYLDTLPDSGNAHGQAFRDRGLEQEVLALTRKTGIGAQFGGKYFCHDVRVIRLPRHGASVPIGLGVSCAADRQILGRIDRGGVFLEQLETNPAQYLPDLAEQDLAGDVVRVDLTRPMEEIRRTLSQHPVKTRLSLSGPLVVARDLAHAKLKALLDAGGSLPPYVKDHPIYYAGPAKTPAGFASGSFGPTTAGRMDSYVDQFMAAGGSHVTLAKGNRGAEVRQACQKHGGFYLGSIGGPAARLAQDCIKRVETLAYPELGMEAIWRIEVEDFPAFVVIDDKGNDFFAKLV
jgi:fumarate hydratase class I